MSAISADSHVVEGPEVFTGLAERFGDEAPRVVSIDGEGDHIVIPARGGHGVNVGFMALASTRLDAEDGIHRRAARKPDAGRLDSAEHRALLEGGYRAMRRGLTDGAWRGEDQDIDGLAAEFLYPGYFTLFGLANTALLIALQKNYNDWLMDFCKAANGRLYGLAVLPVQDPAAAVAELERVIGLGYRGACIPCTSPHERPYFDRAYDPLWARAEEAGLPLSMHVGCMSYVPRELRPGKKRDAIAAYAGAQSVVQDTLVEFICRGVCARHPALKIVVAEFNGGWIAHWLDRLDQGWQREAGRASGVPAYQPVHDIWRRQFWATIEDDQAALMTRSVIGEDRLMWGSDYPHTDSTWPCSGEMLDEMFHGYPPELRARVTRDNVASLYGLGL